jgi:CBS domain containing-hemolysin-like protein
MGFMLASCFYGETSSPGQCFQPGLRVNRRLRPVVDVVQSMAAQIRLGILTAVRRIRRELAASWIRVMPPEELRRVVLAARSGGALDAAGWAMLAGVIDFHQKRAHDVMRPRTEVVALPLISTEDAVRAVVRTEQFSRYPVYRESLDDVVGVFLAKDLWLHEGGTAFSLATFTREPLYVPASRPADRVLDDLRRTRAHMAIVLDEYGGTAGIVTMEDLVEQVVGDIADEYDRTTRRSLEFNGMLELAGSLSVIDVRSAHRLDIPDGEWTTLGGYAFARLGRLPKIGDRVPFPDGELEITAIDGRRVAALRVHRLTADAP